MFQRILIAAWRAGPRRATVHAATLFTATAGALQRPPDLVFAPQRALDSIGPILRLAASVILSSCRAFFAQRKRAAFLENLHPFSARVAERPVPLQIYRRHSAEAFGNRPTGAPDLPRWPKRAEQRPCVRRQSAAVARSRLGLRTSGPTGCTDARSSPVPQDPRHW